VICFDYVTRYLGQSTKLTDIGCKLYEGIWW
jgi:hypothetical protein